MIEKIRPVRATDVNDLKQVVDSCGLFPSEYLDEMVADYLSNTETEDFWFTYLEENAAVAIGYCVPEKFTAGTYNLLAIGVAENFQGKGIARNMMQYIEQVLKEKEGRILIVETSSDEAQTAARNLYATIGYSQEAVIRDFWNEGEDKIVFWKKLN